MPNKHRSRVQEVASNKPNAATAFNLPDSAATGYQSFDSAYATNDTVPYFATNGTAWESGIGTFTAGTPDTLTRTTILESSSGSAIDWSSGGDVTVFVEFPAAYGEKADRVILEADAGAHLTQQSNTITTANLTGVVGALHLCTIAGLTAARDFVLPATCAVGDRIGVYIVDGDDAYALVIKPATGDNINAGTASAEWSRLFIKGECVIFRCTVANDSWIVEYDGRIPMQAAMQLSGAVTTNTANVFTYATTNSGTWTTNIDNASLITTSTDKITVRRACNAAVSTGIRTNSALADTTYCNSGVELNGATLIFSPFFVASSGLYSGQISNTFVYKFATADYIRHTYRTADANKGLAATSGTYLNFTEIL